jgi:hypothetical protein
MDDLGIESRQKQEVFIFVYCPEWFWEPPSLVFNGKWGFLWEVKAAGT